MTVLVVGEGVGEGVGERKRLRNRPVRLRKRHSRRLLKTRRPNQARRQCLLRVSVMKRRGVPETAPATLAQSSPYDTAREYVRPYCFHEGVLATYFWQNEFWEWNSRYYATVEPQIIRDRVYAFLDGSRKFAGGDELTRFKPNPKLVNDVLDALKAGLTLPNSCQPPMWIDK